MEYVGIVGGLRTYIGVEGGMYRNVSAEQLGAHVLRQIPARCGIPVEDIDMVIAGNGIGGQHVSRQNPQRSMQLAGKPLRIIQLKLRLKS